MSTAILMASMLLAAAAPNGQGVKIKDLIKAGTVSPETVQAATAFYDFWNTGDKARLQAAISPDFVDHTLPPGRPQGPEGPAFASDNFRKAVPDLSVEIEKMVVANDYVTVHMVFSGHFTGRFGDAAGKGQAIRFIATDLIRVSHGKVVDNWHIEDNLTFVQQAGLVPAP